MEIDNKKLSMLRKYPYEIALVVLCVCVAFLFKLYISLDSEFKDYLKDGHAKMVEALKESSAVIKAIKN